jgi:hypothetical protein
MKKIGMLLLVLALLGGCSVQIDTSTSKTDEFTSSVDGLSETLLLAKKKFMPFEGKQSFTKEEQAQIMETVEIVTDEMAEFKKEEAPLLGKMVKKVVMKQLIQKEKILLDIKEKAETGTITDKDISTLISTVSDDFEIKLFK